MTPHRRPLDIITLPRPGGSLRIGLGRGTAGQPPLVIFNGLGANLELLEPFLAALDGRTLLVVDAPTVTPGPAWLPYRFGGLALQVKEALPELGITGAVDVMGVSWGGFVAQQFALQYPGLCRRLVLAATTPGVLMFPGSPFTLAAVLGASFLPQGVEEMAVRLFGGDFQRDPHLLQAHLRRLAPQDALSQACQFLALWGWSSLPWLWRLHQPSLVLAGRDDPVVPLPNAQLLAALIPDATLAVLEDGHGFLLSRSREAAGLILDFLSAP